MKRTALSIAVSSALVAAPAMVQAAAEAPYLERDGSWINLSGTVTSTTADTFMLDYGDGLITVEMDDADRHAETRACPSNSPTSCAPSPAPCRNTRTRRAPHRSTF